jgi:hypothetical protein
LETAEQLQDLISNPVEVRAELHQNLSRDAFTFPNQAKQDVLGADVGMIDLEGFAQAKFKYFFCSRREWYVSTWRLLSVADDLFDFLPDSF